MIISAIYTDLFHSYHLSVSCVVSFCLYVHSYAIFIHHFLFQNFSLVFAMLSREVYIHRCALKTSLGEIFISATKSFSTPSVEPAGTQRAVESAGISGIREGSTDPLRNFRHHSTSPRVRVQVCKYVKVSLFLQGCENRSFPSSRQDSETTRSERVMQGRNVTSGFQADCRSSSSSSQLRRGWSLTPFVKFEMVKLDKRERGLR